MMAALGEIKVMGDNIVRSHKGRVYFNFGEAAEIIGCGRHTVAAHLHELGILVTKIGPSKRVSAYDIAELMCKNRVSPV